MSGVLRGLAAAALVLGLWQVLVSVGELSPYILPSPWQVPVALWSNKEPIAWHAGITLVEVVVGLALGAALGIAAAINLAVSPMARYLIRPALVATQSMPVFALAPILTL